MIRRPLKLPAIVSASSAYYFANGLLIFAGLISMPVMTRLLSKPEYGLLGLLYATVSVFAVIGGLGFGEAALRLYSEQRMRGAAAVRDLYNTLLGGSLVVGAIITVAVACGSRWLDAANPSRYLECLPVASLMIVIRTVSGVLFQIYRGQERAGGHALTQIFQRYGTMVLAIGGLLLFQRDAETVIVAAIIIEIMAVAGRWLDLARRGVVSAPTLNRPLLLAATAYGLPLALAGSARFLLDYSDRFLIERMLGLDAVAMYSVPNDIAFKLGDAILTPIQLAALPIMFRLWESEGRQATSRFASDLLTYMIAVTIPIATLYMIHSEEVIVLLASAKYTGAGQLTPYLIPGVLLGSINAVVATGLTVQKRTITVAVTVFGAALLNFLLNLIFIPRWQLIGAATATLVAQAVLLVANRLAGNAFDLRPRYDVVLKAILATALPVGLLYALGRVPTTSILGLVLNLTFGTIAAGLIFVALEPRVRRWAERILATAPASDSDAGNNRSDRRLLMIARDFPPASSSATMRTASFAQRLPALGWKTTVVAISEDFHSDTDTTTMEALPADCHVVRAFGFDTKKKLSVRGRYPSLLAFPDREVSWIFDGTRQALLAHQSAPADLLWSTSPSVSAHCIAYFVKRWTGLPWIAELRDPWNLDAPRGPISYRLDRWLEQRLLAAADVIIVTTPGMAVDLERRCAGGVRGKIKVIANGYDEEIFATLPAARSSGFSIAHVGSCVPPYRDPGGFFQAVRMCIDRGDLPVDTVIDLIGSAEGRDDLWADVQRLNLQTQVRITPRVSSNEASAAIAQASLLLLLQTRRDHDLCIPAKAYEYLRSGCGIVAITPLDSETANLLRTFEGVSVVAPDNVDAIRGALVAAHRTWKEGKTRGFVRDLRRYDRRHLAKEMAQLLDELRYRVRA